MPGIKTGFSGTCDHQVQSYGKGTSYDFARRKGYGRIEPEHGYCSRLAGAAGPRSEEICGHAPQIAGDEYRRYFVTR